MFKKLGKMLNRNVKAVGDARKGNMANAQSFAEGDVKGAFSKAKDSAKMAARGAKDQAKDVGGMAKSAAGRTGAAGLLARRGKSSGVAMASKDMPMGQLDRMRAQRGMIGSIPGQMRDYSKDKA